MLKAVKLSNKGYTLLELLVVISIVTSMSLFFIAPMVLSHELNTVAIIDSQLSAMAQMKRVFYNDTLWFNYKGNINHAQTLKINQLSCVFQLGMGRYTCE